MKPTGKSNQKWFLTMVPMVEFKSKPSQDNLTCAEAYRKISLSNDG